MCGGGGVCVWGGGGGGGAGGGGGRQPRVQEVQPGVVQQLGRGAGGQQRPGPSQEPRARPEWRLARLAEAGAGGEREAGPGDEGGHGPRPREPRQQQRGAGRLGREVGEGLDPEDGLLLLTTSAPASVESRRQPRAGAGRGSEWRPVRLGVRVRAAVRLGVETGLQILRRDGAAHVNLLHMSMKNIRYNTQFRV